MLPAFGCVRRKLHQKISIKDITTSHLGKQIELNGWVSSVRRTSKGLVFIPLKDYDGSIQLMCRKASTKILGSEMEFSQLDQLVTPESVIRARGCIQRKLAPLNKDPNSIATVYLESSKPLSAEFELNVSELEILNLSKNPLPVQLNSDQSSSSSSRADLGLRYRYLDLRRQDLNAILRMRSAISLAVRNMLAGENFTEIETPLLFKRTPEGAKEFLVPTRQPGKFFALPQSPQQYKQLLMASKFEKYYQFAKCFRDEDPRSNRQPEFTQLDIEVAFPTRADIHRLVERIITTIFAHCTKPRKIQGPFKTISYHECINYYGIDKPDLRFDNKITPHPTEQGHYLVFDLPAHIDAKDFAAHLLNETNGMTKLNGRNFSVLTQSNMHSDHHVFDFVFNTSGNQPLANRILVYSKDAHLEKRLKLLGRLRILVADLLRRDFNHTIYDPEELNFAWVEEFPMFERDESRPGKLVAVHHPFTAPDPISAPILFSDPLQAVSQHYDLVLNGEEIAGGSIRNHCARTQREIFEKILGVNSQTFSHLLEALDHGTPPHGGIALGYDRILSIATNTNSIRDVIAFPKTTSGKDLLVGSPSEISPSDLIEYGLVQNQRQ